MPATRVAAHRSPCYASALANGTPSSRAYRTAGLRAFPVTSLVTQSHAVDRRNPGRLSDRSGVPGLLEVGVGRWPGACNPASRATGWLHHASPCALYAATADVRHDRRSGFLVSLFPCRRPEVPGHAVAAAVPRGSGVPVRRRAAPLRRTPAGPRAAARQRGG